MNLRADLSKYVNELLVLTCLGCRPSHGYALGRTLDGATHGVFRFPHGTLYPLLHRLERRGLVRVRAGLGPTNRRVYEITETGELALRAGVEELEQQLSMVLRALRTDVSTFIALRDPME